ncbi:hypothetical protein HMPREF0977_02687 [Clostridium sp. 1_1_41A1FAA]|nr:hypothetical protein HMPREF0977_02687 [Clostridium sp. 1_1_41A1FAA]
MPKLNVLNIQGQNVGEIELSDAVFGVEVNEHVLYEVVKTNLLIKDKVLNLLKLEQKLEVAEENLGDKKEQVELDKVL